MTEVERTDKCSDCSADNNITDKYGKELKIVRSLGIGGCVDAEVEGDFLYMISGISKRLTGEFNYKSDNGGTLYIADISDTSSPRMVGKLHGLGTVRQLEVKDRIVFVAAREDGVFIIDAAVPSAPRIISHYDSVEFATGIDIYGKLALVANRIHGVEVVDITDLEHPLHLSVLRTGEAQSIDTADGYAYAGIWGQRELVVCDIRNPYIPRIAARVKLDGKGDGVFVRGKYCYVATGHHARGTGDIYDESNPAYGCGNGMEIYDISDPENPQFVSRVKVDKNYTEFNHMWTVTVSGNYAYLAHSYIGLFVYDVSDPASPKNVARVSVPNDTDWPVQASIGGIAIVDDYIYAAGMYTDLFVVAAPGLAEVVADDNKGDMYIDGHALENKPEYKTAYTIQAEMDAPEFKVYKPQGQVYSVAFKDDRAFATCGSDGIHIIEMGKQLKKVRKYATDGFAMDIKIRDDTVYVAEGEGGLSIWKLAGDDRMDFIGRYKAYGKPVRHVVVPGKGRYAVLQAGSRWLQIADVSDPQDLRLVLADSPESGKGMISGKQIGDGPGGNGAVSGLIDERYTCCFWHITGIYWYDIYGSEKPVYSGFCQHQRINLSSGIAFTHNKAILTRNKGYVMLDYKYGGNLDDLVHYYVGGGVNINGKPAIYGNTMFVTDRINGTVMAIDITDIAKPHLIKNFKIDGNPDLVVVCGNGKKAAIPAGYQGLLIFDL